MTQQEGLKDNSIKELDSNQLFYIGSAMNIFAILQMYWECLQFWISYSKRLFSYGEILRRNIRKRARILLNVSRIRCRILSHSNEAYHMCSRIIIFCVGYGHFLFHYHLFSVINFPTCIKIWTPNYCLSILSIQYWL